MATAPRIMIVEDEVIVAMEIQNKLMSSDYQIVGMFSDGDKAVQAARRIKPDLVFMDITLTGKTDGIQAATEIRDEGIPVVFLTAHSDEATLQRAKMAEPYGYLLKPFSAAELRTTVEVSLHKHIQERKAKERDRCFAATVGLFGGAVIVTDESGIISNMNSLAEALTAWQAENAIGRSIARVCLLSSPETENCAHDLIQHLGVPGWSAKVSCNLTVEKTGEVIPLELAIAALDDGMNGTTVVWGFHETVCGDTSEQDWFSQSVNLQIAARLALASGRAALAESYYLRALALSEDNLGRRHPKVGHILESLNEMQISSPDGVRARLTEFRTPGAASKALTINEDGLGTSTLPKP